MLAYGHSLSHDHQGFRPFSPDHREAAGPVGPAVARVQVHYVSFKQCLHALARPRRRNDGGHAGDELHNVLLRLYSGASRGSGGQDMSSGRGFLHST